MKLNQTVEDILSSGSSEKTHFRQYSKEVSPSLILPRDQYEVLAYDEIKKNNLARVWGMKDGKKIVMVVEVMLDEFKE